MTFSGHGGTWMCIPGIATDAVLQSQSQFLLCLLPIAQWMRRCEHWWRYVAPGSGRSCYNVRAACACVCVRVIYLFVYIYKYLFVFIYMYMYVCMYMYIYVYIYVYIHAHIFVHISKHMIYDCI